MPWEIVERDGKHCVVKQDGGETVACHGTRSEAEAQMQALYASEDSSALHTDRAAFEPFVSLAGILSGAPLRILPEGRWYRDDRVLDITPDRLLEFATNIKSGLPRFRVPINLDHADGGGKVGTIHDLEYMPSGPDGAGLYATKYEITERGHKAIVDDGYDGISAEAVWSLYDGATYQDPMTGTQHDNTLVGVALTPTPFFGHQAVGIYSAFGARKGAMAETKTEIKSDDMAVKEQADKLAAAEKRAEELSARVEALTSDSKDIAEKLASVQRERRRDQLVARCEKFEAIPVKPSDLADKMQALETADPKLFEWFDGLLSQMDGVLVRAGIFEQRVSPRPGSVAETLHEAASKINKDKFGGKDYASALHEAAREQPDLVAEYRSGSK